MKDALKKIFGTSLIRNTAKMSVSSLFTYLLPLIVTPILSRLYEPEMFGEWGVFSSFTAIVTTGLFLGFDNTIVKTRNENLKNITVLCFIISFTIISLITISFFIARNLNITFFKDFPNSNLLIFYLLFYSFFTVFFNLANKYEKYTVLAISNFIQGCSQAIFRILFGIICLVGINGLILGTTIAQGVVTIFLFICIINAKTLKKQLNVSMARLKKLLYEYRNFPLFDTPSSILSFAAFNLPIIILSMFFNKASIGCFSIILQLLLLPMSLIGSAMGKVYYQELCKNENNFEHRKTVTKKVIKITALISIIPLLLIACGGDKLIILFLGSKWSAAGNIAICLSMWSFPTILTQPLLPLFRQLNKQKTLLFFDSMYFIFSIGSILFMCKQTDNLYHILISFSIACLCVKSCLFMKILSLSELKLKQFSKFFPLWIVAFIILTGRLVLL